MIQFLALAALDIAGLVVLWFLLRARVRRYLELDSLLSGVREESRALVIELNEAADRNVSLLEDRMAALRGLLDEVDRRLGVAKRELDSRETEREVFDRLRRRRPLMSARDGDEAPIPLELRSSELRSSEPRPGSAPPEAEPSSGPEREEAASRRLPELRLSPEPIAPGRSRREEAFDLYRKGFSADIIAARLGATVAEIELLIDIEERRSETGLGG